MRLSDLEGLDPSRRAALVRALRDRSLAALRELSREAPWGGDPERGPLLVRALMRLVVLLFAEARGLFGDRLASHLDEVFGPALPDDLTSRARALLEFVEGERIPYETLDLELVGSVYEGLIGFDGEAKGQPKTLARRRLGAHFTSRDLTKIMVERALSPLVPEDAPPERILSLRVCDPAMGAGAFLLEACRFLAERLAQAWERAVDWRDKPEGVSPIADARRLVAGHCLFGVDKDPLAVHLARVSLWLFVAPEVAPGAFLARSLRHGDSVLGAPRAEIERAAMIAPGDPSLRSIGDALIATWLGAHSEEARKNHSPFHWEIEFEDVFSRGGFDAFVGNPPWVSYAGRAAQPLAPELRKFFAKTNPAFAGYRNLHGMFVRQSARLLRPGGRLGFVLPTSTSDLDGYEPTRRAHDELSEVDADLPDFGDAFDNVFQPSMGLLSTRRPEPLPIAKAGPWPLSRPDLDNAAADLLARLAALPTLPAHLFGERGFQTTGDDVDKLLTAEGPEGRFCLGLRVGGDVEGFLRRSPRLYCDPSDFGPRLRSPESFQTVRLLIRQTARFPLAALSDGLAFRNSLLAGFSDEAFSEFFLLVWLNSSPIRWYHHTRNRDARQGMPQMKIAHLRALPAPPSRDAVPELEALGREFGARNTGVTEEEQGRIDVLVSEALGLGGGERLTVKVFVEMHVFPAGRRRG